MKQLMNSVLEPAADVYWDAVGSVTDAKGTVEMAPRTPEEWDAVRNNAVVLAESGNLLMLPSRAVDDGEWMVLSRALITASRQAISAAEARDRNAVFDAGAVLYEACTACHAKYAIEHIRPGSK
ncbi:MAG: hypothetical protein ACT4P7_22155 [Gemmatimonadaceae bacterium]